MILAAFSLFSFALASNVVTLNTANFADTLALDGGKLIEFYAEWCAPIYEELADAFSFSKEVTIAKIDADKEKSIGAKYDVKGFPTIKWFARGSDVGVDYSGGRDLESLSAFITEKTGVMSKGAVEKISHVKVLLDSDFSSEVLDPSKMSLVEFYAPWCGHCKKLAPTWDLVAEAFKNEKNCVVAKLDAVDNPETAKEYGVKGYPTLKFFGKDNEPEDYSGGRDEKSLIDFLNVKCGTHRVPGGGLLPSAGLDEELTQFAVKFMSTTDKIEREVILDKAGERADMMQVDDRNKQGQYYIKVMNKIVAKGDGHVDKEIARLSKMIDAKAADSNKLDDFEYRVNILNMFKAGPVEEKEVGEDASEDEVEHEDL